MIKTTGLVFKKGQALTSEALNILNDRINDLVRTVNLLLQDRVNVNIEILGNTETTLDFVTAVSEIPSERRIPGITVKFNHSTYGWSSWVWTGSGLWSSQKTWIRIDQDESIIDGGEV